MKQIFAIFTKDARRFWPEILVSLALLVAFNLVYPSQWRPTDGSEIRAFGRFFGANTPQGFLASCLVVLIPISWWILIARVIHGERLVGDNQFWVTRPYEWPKFLAAKLLFLAAFLYAPFFLAQSVLLAEGGFHPFSYFHGLFYNLLLVTGILVLPLAAFSTITSGFGRLTLVLLAVILFIAGMALIYSLLPPDKTGGVSGPLGDNLSFLLITCGCAAVVVVQYATRKARLAWLLIAFVAVLMSALAFFDPDQAFMDRNYPVQGPTAANFMQFSYAPKPWDQPQPMTYETKDKSVLEVVVPVQVSGLAEGYAAIPVAVKATIEAPGGARWQSPWQVIYNERHLSGSSDSSMRFMIRRAVYDKFNSTPVTLHLMVAIDRAHAVSTTSIPVSTSEFSVSGFGICVPRTNWFIRPRDISGISCRSAMRQPQLTYVTAQWTDAECSVEPSERETVLGVAWAGSFGTDPAEFGITSVWETGVVFSNMLGDYREGQKLRRRRICPGSPITFTRYDRIGRSQQDVTIQGFQLPKLDRAYVTGFVE